MNKRRAVVVAACLASLFAGRNVDAMPMHGGTDTHGSRQEAVAMVKKGAAYIKTHGAEEGYAQIMSEDGQFRDRDLYLVVYRLDGTVLAHGQNERMVNKNLIGLRDLDGKLFIKETVELARTKDTFWMDHKFTNPMTKKVHPMHMYCERLDDSVICSGHFMF